MHDALNEFGYPNCLGDNTATPLTCANCGEVSTNPGQFMPDGLWICTESCRAELCASQSANGGIPQDEDSPQQVREEKRPCFSRHMAGCAKDCYNAERCAVGWPDGSCGRLPRGQGKPPKGYWRKLPCSEHTAQFNLECPACNGKNAEWVETP